MENPRAPGLAALGCVLLVEDDPSDVHLAMAVFRENQWAEHVCVITDGAQALDYVHSRGRFEHRPPGGPAVILLDLKLPLVNGFQVLEEVRASASLKLIPVIVLTSSGEDRDVRRAYELGANGYVVKSISFPAYHASLRAIGAYWVMTNQPPPGSLQPAPSTRNLV